METHGDADHHIKKKKSAALNLSFSSTAAVWWQGMFYNDNKNRKSWSKVFPIDAMTKLCTERPSWSFLWLGEKGTTSNEVRRRNVALRGYKKSFSSHKQLHYSCNFDQNNRVLWASEKGCRIFLSPLSGQLTCARIWQSIGIITFFFSPVFPAGSKPIDVEQLQLDTFKNKLSYLMQLS